MEGAHSMRESMEIVLSTINSDDHFNANVYEIMEALFENTAGSQKRTERDS